MISLFKTSGIALLVASVLGIGSYATYPLPSMAQGTEAKTGRCVPAIATGRVRCDYDSGDSYIGDFVNGLPSGTGVYRGSSVSASQTVKDNLSLRMMPASRAYSEMAKLALGQLFLLVAIAMWGRFLWIGRWARRLDRGNSFLLMAIALSVNFWGASL